MTWLQLINVDIRDDPADLLQPLTPELHAEVEGDKFFFSWVEAKARWEVLHCCRLTSYFAFLGCWVNAVIFRFIFVCIYIERDLKGERLKNLPSEWRKVRSSGDWVDTSTRFYVENMMER